MKIKSLHALIICFLLVCVFSCEEEEIIPEPPDTGDFYFLATINDRSKHLIAGNNGYGQVIEIEEHDSGTNPDIVNVSYTSGMAQINTNYHIKSSEAAFVKFDQNWFNKSDYTADPIAFFSSVFTEGEKNFCSHDNTAMPCIEILWEDTYSKEWTTRNGDQTGSSITVESVESSVSGGEHFRILKAIYNCTLYNSVNEELELRNGKFFLVFRSI